MEKLKTSLVVVKKDDKTVVLKYKEIKPALLWGNGFVAEFLNKSQVEAASKRLH